MELPEDEPGVMPGMFEALALANPDSLYAEDNHEYPLFFSFSCFYCSWVIRKAASNNEPVENLYVWTKKKGNMYEKSFGFDQWHNTF
jgi:hypothetical protein